MNILNLSAKKSISFFVDFYPQKECEKTESKFKGFQIKLVWVDLLRSKFKRSTQKLTFRSTHFDYVVYVDIDDCTLHMSAHFDNVVYVDTF